ncbi:MAG TPA: biotin--[acetyl-CoA-carboxylase] ligase [Firmicutes bacterium]|jgi:BirA family biotin operon repressor/biotin-[acetyl-CoA-carboxylase] ligase|nr:biotin--[acetyl-CoA-carboxylase] ligase [Bacillota bacterium]
MRQKILQLLRDNSSGYFSGEEMARMLGVSRTAIWKNIQSLLLDGYHIESSPRLGYRLVRVPDLLYPAEILKGLKTKIIASGPELIYHFLQVDSTNTSLKKLADQGAADGTVVIAEEQTAGRGRLGRSWFSPAGKSITLSILLRPSLAPGNTPLFTLMTAAAIVRGIKNILPDISVGIKWPNDLMINKRKVSGILTELKAEADLLHYLIIGIGININSEEKDFPPELRNIATSLFLENNKTKISRQQLLCEILQELDDAYRRYFLENPAFIIKEWKKFDITLGRKITVKTIKDTFIGTAVDLAADGSLILEEVGGKKRQFQAGEVTLV